MREWIKVIDDIPDAGEYVLAKISPPIRGSKFIVANLTQLVSGYFHWMTVLGDDVEGKVIEWRYLEKDNAEDLREELKKVQEENEILRRGIIEAVQVYSGTQNEIIRKKNTILMNALIGNNE